MKNWFRFHRDLGWQLLALYLLLIIPFLVTLWFFDTVVGERIQNDVAANDLSLARAIAQETDLSISNALIAVQELARYPGVIDADKKSMESLFSVILNTRPDVNLVYRLDADGIMLYHYPVGPGSTLGIDFSFRDYYQRALESTTPLVSKGRISPTTEQAVATAVMPIRSADGRFLGLVAEHCGDGCHRRGTRRHGHRARCRDPCGRRVQLLSAPDQVHHREHRSVDTHLAGSPEG